MTPKSVTSCAFRLTASALGLANSKWFPAQALDRYLGVWQLPDARFPPVVHHCRRAMEAAEKNDMATAQDELAAAVDALHQQGYGAFCTARKAA